MRYPGASGDAAVPIDIDGLFTRPSFDGKTRLLVFARSFHAESNGESAEC